MLPTPSSALPLPSPPSSLSGFAPPPPPPTDCPLLLLVAAGRRGVARRSTVEDRRTRGPPAASSSFRRFAAYEKRCFAGILLLTRGLLPPLAMKGAFSSNISESRGWRGGGGGGCTARGSTGRRGMLFRLGVRCCCCCCCRWMGGRVDVEGREEEEDTTSAVDTPPRCGGRGVAGAALPPSPDALLLPLPSAIGSLWCGRCWRPPFLLDEEEGSRHSATWPSTSS